MIVHRFDKARCPHCATAVTAAGEVDGTGTPIPGAGPQDGDLTLCPNCLQILAFRTDPTLSLAEPEEAELVGIYDQTVAALRQARQILLDTRPYRWLVMVKGGSAVGGRRSAEKPDTTDRRPPTADQTWTISAFGPVDKKDVDKRVHQIFAMRRASFVAEWCCPPREDQIRACLEAAEHPEELMGLGSCVNFFVHELRAVSHEH